jgi:hypothetical protein
MPFDLPLRCRCGRVRGIASEFARASGFRLVCYCKDCQAFARFLDRADVLDAAGGTDIVQMPPGRVKLTVGTDAVRSLQFSNKVFRWYADCCGTPIANTASSARVPFFGLVHSFIGVEAEGLLGMRFSMRFLARRCVASTSAPPPGRSRRMRPRRPRPAFLFFAQRRCSAGGGTGSADRTHSSTIVPARRSPRRASSPAASARLFEWPNGRSR